MVLVVAVVVVVVVVVGRRKEKERIEILTMLGEAQSRTTVEDDERNRT